MTAERDRLAVALDAEMGHPDYAPPGPTDYHFALADRLIAAGVGMDCGDAYIDGYQAGHAAGVAFGHIDLDVERLARALAVAARQPGWGIENAEFDARLIAAAYREDAG